MTDLLSKLPTFDHDLESLAARIRSHCERSQLTIVVLDDDPTGTQTVYDTNVLTAWDVETLRYELRRRESLFFILTNSRALGSADATNLAREIGRNLKRASEELGRKIVVVSRSDSTLRGHYPAEVDSLASGLGLPGSIQVIMPFFLQGGRLTVDDTHYVVEQETWTPAAETPFAKDATFGFSKSNLQEWVAEKRQGFEARETVSLSIEDLRTRSVDSLADEISGLAPQSVLVVNAVSIHDARVFALAAHQALAEMADGASLIFRTAASFVQAFAGLEERPLLEGPEMVDANQKAGLIVVGSYVPKTTKQLDELLRLDTPPIQVQLDVDKLLDQDDDAYVGSVIENVEQHLRQSRDVVLHTSRRLVTGPDGDASLRIGNRVSETLVKIVAALSTPLRFLIAKGGITSSDIATKALKVRRASVLGQILPGVPVWALNIPSKDRPVAYVVFPGNVGTETALAEAYEKLRVSV
ncbi:MAG: four-carbon acid sugar kinase family protein [Planctomycetota bacterium]